MQTKKQAMSAHFLKLARKKFPRVVRIAQFFSQILPTILSAVSGSPDNIVATLKEAGRLIIRY
jgi:hypothetical protein